MLVLTTALVTLVLGATAARDTVPVPVRPVAAVDLERYAGLWHEVARLPNRFQQDCAGETTAEYTLLGNGQLRVVNSCRRTDGSPMRAEGRARLADADGPASRLKVRFAPAFLSFLPMVWGDYWILDLTEDYGAALVGDPSRKYLWMLSRSPKLDPTVYTRFVSTAAAQGFDTSRLVWTQAGPTPALVPAQKTPQRPAGDQRGPRT